MTSDERAELESRVRSRKIRAEDARRAPLILMPADGDSYSTIEAPRLHQSVASALPRRSRGGLRARYKGQPPTILTPKMEAPIGEDAGRAARRVR